MIVINSPDNKEIKGFKVFSTDATKIALETIGRPVVNTAVLGAFAKVTNLVTMKSLEEAINERFSGELAKKNVKAMERAYEETVVE